MFNSKVTSFRKKCLSVPKSPLGHQQIGPRFSHCQIRIDKWCHEKITI